VNHAPGREYRYDAEYKRNGVSNLFMLFAPLQGWRHVEVTDRRTKVDWARVIKELVDEHFPEAKKIILVMDNLNTHNPSSLYEAFSPEEAKRILSKLEIHYTPKHGSWLNMAEIELSVLGRQCLSRRIPDQEALRREVNAWETHRNKQEATVDWRFSTKDARIKLKRLYPSFVV
jgi:transposase